MSNEPTPAPTTSDSKVRTWAMILHLSQFATYLLPVVGMIVPVLIWQIKKAEMPELDVHGKIIVNWIISFVIYAVVSTVLLVAFIGYPLWMALAAAGVIFPIIGGLKASNGEAWKYPLSITFLK